MTDPLPGAWTVDMDCKWQGAITDADLTCTAIAGGYALEAGVPETTTTVWKKDEIVTSEYFATFAVVTQTPSGSASVSPSKGLAAAGPLPTGAMAMMGGAAGVFAAAMAL
jgi:hypothetical protein